MSTTMAINKLTEIINKGFEDGLFTHALFLDLTKAFDCVSHDILLQKLAFYRFNNSSIKLIKSYLEDRYQYVYYNNNKSELRNIQHGVPQGSVLGPLLFLIYVNDLPDLNCTAKFVLFADDTTIVHRSNDFDSIITEVAKTESIANDWLLANKLTLNKTKSENMIFTLRQLGDVDDIELKECVKFLGVYIDNKLSWEHHANSVCKKVSNYTYLLRNLAKQVSQSTLVTAYFGLVQSAISYALLAWGHSSHSSSVFAMQRRAIRVIDNLPYRADCRESFKKLKLLTLPCLYIYQCLIYIKSNLTEYTSHNEIHTYQTRNRDNINLEFLRLTKSRDGQGYYAIKFYNALPKTVKDLDYEKYKLT